MHFGPPAVNLFIKKHAFFSFSLSGRHRAVRNARLPTRHRTRPLAHPPSGVSGGTSAAVTPSHVNFAYGDACGGRFTLISL